MKMMELVSYQNFDTDDLSRSNLDQTKWVNFDCVKVIKIANFSKFKTSDVSKHTVTFKDFDSRFLTTFRLTDILVYPNGIDHNHKDFVSVAVDVLEMNRYNFRFDCTICILNNEGEPIIPQSFCFNGSLELDSIPHQDSVEDTGLERYVSRLKLFAEADELLLEDTLTLQCELSYSIPKQFQHMLGYQFNATDIVKYISYSSDGNFVDYREYENGKKLFESVEEACEIYKIAHAHEREELSMTCSRYLARNLDVCNIVKISSLAYKFNDFWLKSVIAAFIPSKKLVLLESSAQRFCILKVIDKLLTEIPLEAKELDAINQGRMKQKYFINQTAVSSLQELVSSYLRKRTIILIQSLSEACVLYDITDQFGRSDLREAFESFIIENLSFTTDSDWEITSEYIRISNRREQIYRTPFDCRQIEIIDNRKVSTKIFLKILKFGLEDYSFTAICLLLAILLNILIFLLEILINNGIRYYFEW